MILKKRQISWFFQETQFYHDRPWNCECYLLDRFGLFGKEKRQFAITNAKQRRCPEQPKKKHQSFQFHRNYGITVCLYCIILYSRAFSKLSDFSKLLSICICKPSIFILVRFNFVPNHVFCLQEKCSQNSYCRSSAKHFNNFLKKCYCCISEYLHLYDNLTYYLQN